MTQKKIFIFIGIFWILILGGFIGSKQIMLQTGKEVLLKSAPVDPRDLFRGDYVILRHEISELDTKDFSMENIEFQANERIYVSLSLDSQKMATATALSKTEPEEGDFILGAIKNAYPVMDMDAPQSQMLSIEYGIESYFVPENRGREIEENLAETYTKVALSESGKALIKALVLDGKEIELE